jgi:hypothetical protein
MRKVDSSTYCISIDTATRLANVPRKTSIVLRDLSQLLREPERWPEGFRWHYGTINTCAIGLCREALGERAYRKLASHIDYRVFCALRI